MDNSSSRKYELLLIAVIAARATSFIFTKLILQNMDTFNLLAIRFILAFILMSVFFFRHLKNISRKDLFGGLIIGVSFFIMMSFELMALSQADSSLISLLENCSVIFVPAVEAVIVKKLPTKINLICTGAAMVGVILLAIQQGNLNGGFILGLVAAACYTAAIIITARVSKGGSDPLAMGIVQVGTIGILALIASFIFETPHLMTSGAEWLMLALLVIVCTGFGFTLQPVAQKHVSVERAGMFCAVSPAIAVILGVVVLHEKLNVYGIIGIILILASIILPYAIKPAKQ